MKAGAAGYNKKFGKIATFGTSQGFKFGKAGAYGAAGGAAGGFGKKGAFAKGAAAAGFKKGAKGGKKGELLVLHSAIVTDLSRNRIRCGCCWGCWRKGWCSGRCRIRRKSSKGWQSCWCCGRRKGDRRSGSLSCRFLRHRIGNCCLTGFLLSLLTTLIVLRVSIPRCLSAYPSPLLPLSSLPSISKSNFKHL